MERQNPPITYALDIGTRKVAGLLVEHCNKTYRIVGAEIIEQEAGAMRDGQIHDISQVADTISEITSRLSKCFSPVPRQVAVAAAGRALKTAIGSARQPISPLQPVNNTAIQALEIQAVLRARETLSPTQTDESLSTRNPWASEYIFVAYSPMTYYLDDEPIGALAGHRGSSIGVDVIATFLPRVVVDSLSAALTAAGLEIASLTLEPIAALRVAIPPSMRRLNLALVDVGAGTSDIAITRAGTVLAYGMVPLAGDEITETLCQHYLLDFTEAEALKRGFQQGSPPVVRDALGQELRLKPQEIEKVIRPAVTKLAEAVGREILRLGDGPPQAVLCVGGGSLTPTFPQTLATVLDLPPNRVAVRGRDAIQGVEGAEQLLTGPECITPIGIAVEAIHTGRAFLQATVNGRPVRVLDLSTPTVKEALLAAGIGIRELQGKPGAALTVTVNGKIQVIPGTLGENATINMNGKTVSLDTPLENGANITIEPPSPGQDATACLQDVVDIPPPLKLTYEGKPIEVPPCLVLNGKPAQPETVLQDRDVVEVIPRHTVKDVLNWLRSKNELPAEQILRYTLNGREYTRYIGLRVLVNGVELEETAILHTGDQLKIEPEQTRFTLRELKDSLEADLLQQYAKESITVTLNQQPVTLTRQVSWNYKKNGQPVLPEEEVADGDVLIIEPVLVGSSSSKSGTGFILSDIFRFTDFAPSEPGPGKQLSIRINGESAGFTSPVSDGDVITISWE